MAATTTTTTTTTCTTVAIYDDEIAQYFSSEQQKRAAAIHAAACALCGSADAKAYFSICKFGEHHACGPCAKKPHAIARIEPTRAGPKKCCGAPDCKAEFLGPIPAPAFTAVVRAARPFVEETLREKKADELRGNAGAELRRELVGSKKRKNVSEYAAGSDERLALQAERAADRVAAKKRKVEREEKEREFARLQRLERRLLRTYGRVWVDEIEAESESESESDDEAVECGECLSEEEE